MQIPWNKGLKKETDDRVNNYSKKISKSLTGKTRKSLTEETRKNLSIKLKLAHKEGRAWNIGMSRWNNKPSYPESFFMKVIENEFEDKNYKKEFNVGIYSIDFAWIHKKIAIEIDGKQHEDIIVKNRDEKKNKFLIENGWKLLRIKWIDMYRQPNDYINQARQFVNSYQIISVDKLFLTNKEEIIYNKRKLKKEKINKKINLIKNSNINFSKFGWVNEVAKLLNMKTQHINKWMKRHMLNFYSEKCFRRK